MGVFDGPAPRMQEQNAELIRRRFGSEFHEIDMSNAAAVRGQEYSRSSKLDCERGKGAMTPKNGWGAGREWLWRAAATKAIALFVCAMGVLTLMAPTGRAQSVTAVVATGTAPRAVALNPVTNKIYVANNGSSSVTVIDGATNNTTTVNVGSFPDAVAVNPVADKIYVANAGSGTVTVIDGATNATTTVNVGSNPDALAVNPLTNTIYAVNFNASGTVTVIDGATNSTMTVNVGSLPDAVAVNPVTNKIYVANSGSANVTVIDGASNGTSTVAVGASPVAVAVNPVTNKIYVANGGSANVTVIDGASSATTSVNVGTNPRAVAVNPVTDKIYVANSGSANVTVINGATNATSSVSAGTGPSSVGVDATTNEIYVANSTSNTVTVINGATNATTTVADATARAPVALTVNPVTDKIYVANQNSNTVTVIDGATNSTTTVADAGNPVAAAVNPVTNKIYVANRNTNDVTVIDGATNSTTTVAAGTNPVAVAVNPVTNKIYVGNENSANVTVMDGATNSTTTVATAGLNSFSVAVNPVTNKIYVGDGTGFSFTVIDGATYNTTEFNSGFIGSQPDVTVNPVTNKIYTSGCCAFVGVIDGATNNITGVAVGDQDLALDVNPLTDKIYVADGARNTLTVIDGVTNRTSAVAVGSFPRAVAVNPVTNKIYVANESSNSVTVVDGATNSTTTVNVGSLPGAVAVNPVTNKIYVANRGSANMTVIDGATNSTTTVAVGTYPYRISVAVNPVTNKVYVPTSTGVTVINEQQTQAVPLTVAISPLSGNVTIGPPPTFNFTAASNYSPNAPVVNAVYFQFDSWQGKWTAASSAGAPGSFTGAALALEPGTHIVYAFATDGQDATSTMGGGSSPVIGALSAYLFTVVRLGSGVAVTADVDPVLIGNPVKFTAAVATVPQSSTIPTGSVTFIDNTTATALGTVPLDNTGHASLTASPLSVSAGVHSITAQYSGDTSYSVSTAVPLSEGVVDFTFVLPEVSSITVKAGQDATYILQLRGLGGRDTDQLSVTVTCLGAPSEAICTAPALPVTVTQGENFFALVVSTTAKGSLVPSAPSFRPRMPWNRLPVLCVAELLLLLLLHAHTRMARHGRRSAWAARLAFATPVLLLAMTMMVFSGCNGSTTVAPALAPAPAPTPVAQNSGTPPGTYTLVVTAKSGNVTHTQQLTLIVE